MRSESLAGACKITGSPTLVASRCSTTRLLVLLPPRSPHPICHPAPPPPPYPPVSPTPLAYHPTFLVPCMPPHFLTSPLPIPLPYYPPHCHSHLLPRPTSIPLPPPYHSHLLTTPTSLPLPPPYPSQFLPIPPPFHPILPHSAPPRTVPLHTPLIGSPPALITALRYGTMVDAQRGTELVTTYLVVQVS